MAPSSGSSGLKVRVRMYRQGFGDCFLLSFMEGAARTHMMIDCGVHASYPKGAKRIMGVVNHVKKETNGQIGVLAVTHQHWDHVSGFDQASEVFKSFNIGESWSSWTEDPDDATAREIQGHYAKARMALRAAADEIKRSQTPRGGTDEVARKSGLNDLRGFAGPLGVGEDSDGGKVATAMAWASSCGRVVRHLSPFGTPIGVPGVSGVRVFVLGPPKDESRLDDDDPHAGEGFRTGLSRSAALGGLMAERLDASLALRSVNVKAGRAVDEWDRFTPFTPDHWKLDRKSKKAAPFPSSYLKQDGWRRIDGAWAAAAEELALWMDGHTNNTSLVLAVQLPRSGKVLLFAGDAQAGNWRSWHDRPFDVGGGKTVMTKELLARTVLYKVAHHGSLNATMNKMGLELMTHPELIAMLPLFMEPLGKKWKMPGTGLYRALLERTRGRVIWADPTPPAGLVPSGGSVLKAMGVAESEHAVIQSNWKKLQKSVKSEDKFVELVISD